jgi:uncharacterized protein (DUF4415 family)
MTVKQMQAAREQGLSKTDWALLRQNLLNGIEPEEDEDSPDASVLMREAVEKRCIQQSVAARSDKEQVAIRFDKDILAFFQATGAGWQSRMNDALREWVNAHSHTV